ncbi:MAG: MFS transporter [Thermoplasmata archaeon]|nr:MFS transporter [Thermoplasmata archaeon]
MVLPPGRRTRPAAALFVARVVYAFNWYNVGAVLPLIGSTLGATTAELGLVLGLFLLGVGVFQVPAGLAAIRWDAKRVSLAGLGTMSVCCILSAFAPTWEWLAAARFMAGVGAAFFFSPALSLIASYYPPGVRGPVVGLYNGGFSVGGAIGLFAGASAGASFGWPTTLGVGGAVLAILTGVAAIVLPPENRSGVRRSLGAVLATGRTVLRSRSIWALSLGLTGFWAAIYIVAQYFVKFAHDVHPGWGIGTAAALSALTVVVSFPGGPVGGWIAERGWDRRWLIGLFGLATGVLVLVLPFTPLWALWPLFGVLGFVDGMVFAVLYLIPAYLPESHGEGLALGVAVINSIQVMVGSGLAITFGFIAAAHGYRTAWLLTGVLALGLLPLLVGVKPNRGMRRSGRLAVPSAPPPVGVDLPHPEGESRRR